MTFAKARELKKNSNDLMKIFGGRFNAACGLNMTGSDSYVITLRKKAEEGEQMEKLLFLIAFLWVM